MISLKKIKPVQPIGAKRCRIYRSLRGRILSNRRLPGFVLIELFVAVAVLMLGTVGQGADAARLKEKDSKESGRARGRAFDEHRAVPPAVVVNGDEVATVVCPNGCSPTFADHHPIHLVYKGDTMRYSPPVSVATAVRFLVEGVEKITGRKPVVVEEGAPVVGPQIHVGQTKLVQKTLGSALKTLDREGCILLATPEALLVTGGDEYGTVFAVSALLEKYAGARWFFPGDLGKVFPKQDRLVLETVNWQDEPAYKSRDIFGMEHDGLFDRADMARNIEWQLWNHIRYGRFRYHHNLQYLLPAAVYAKAHPEWYPLIHGKRTVPPSGSESASWKPCLSAPGLAEEVARLAISHFDAQPDEESFSLGQADGAGWCECEGCVKMDGPAANKIWGEHSGRYTRRVVVFGNRVAELVSRKYPRKVLGFLAYSTYLSPPDDLKLHPMLMPYITSARDGYADPDFRKRDEANLEGWGRIASQVGLYEYFYGYGLVVPRIYTGVLADVLRQAYARGARGWTCEAFPNWGLDAPKLHALTKLLWDPESDPDVLLDDFCGKLFGPAAAPMREMFHLVEKAWAVPFANKSTRGGWFQIFNGNPAQLLPYTPEVAAAINAKCAEARRAAGTDKLAAERVEFFAKCYEMINLLLPSYRAQQLLQNGGSMRDVLAAMRPDEQPLKDRLLAYRRDHRFGVFEMYPLFGDGSTESLVRQLSGNEQVGFITSRFGRQLAREVIDQAGVKDAAAPAEFIGAFRDALEVSVQRQLGETPAGSHLERMRRQVREWAVKVAPAFRAAPPPLIDGRMDDAAWKESVRNQNFAAYFTGKPVDTRTQFAVCRDDDQLYLGVWCNQDQAELAAVGPARNRDEWDRNSVEVFLGQEGETAPVWQIVLSRGGQVWDGCNGEASWNAPGLRCAGNVTTNQWTAEAAIPWKDLGMDPKRERVLLLNVVRNRCYKLSDDNFADEISTWFLSTGGHSERKNRSFLLLK